MQRDSGQLGFIEDAAQRVRDTMIVLRDRAAMMEEGLRESAAGALESVAGAGETNPDLAAVQASIRSVMQYIQENPVQATLLAVGAGMIATSMWNERAGQSARRR